MDYIDQLADKEIKVLVPGCGNGHEVKYLHDKGFNRVTVVDISAEPIKTLMLECPDWQAKAFIVDNFFNINGQFDLIIEQTFFCALSPQLRHDYARQVYDLLAPGGKLVGVLFNVPFPGNNPPFGGTKEEYYQYFKDRFKFKVFEDCTNSIQPRAGEELFINLVKADVIRTST